MNNFLKPKETTEQTIKLSFSKFLDFIDENFIYWDEENEGEFKKFLGKLRKLENKSEKEIKNFILLNLSSKDFYIKKMCKSILSNKYVYKKYVYKIQIRKIISKKILWVRHITNVEILF